jgi:hypothetical protein
MKKGPARNRMVVMTYSIGHLNLGGNRLHIYISDNGLAGIVLIADEKLARGGFAFAGCHAT